MKKISWTEKKSIEEILRLVGEERCVLEVFSQEEESLDWSCNERGWTVEPGHRGKNTG